MDRSPKNQKELTERYILPNIRTILKDIVEIRKNRVDVKLRNDPSVLALLAYWKKEYPLGLCAQIRNAMLDQFFDEANQRRYQGISMIMDFVRAGGIIMPFWGVDKDQYFENAILIGDAVLDVANDTVYTYKKPVEFYPSLKTSPLKLIASFDKVAEIAEAYWHHDIYPNIYFPELAPAFPLMAVVKTHDREGRPVRGLIIMGDFVDLHPRNVHMISSGHACGLAYDFISRSPYRTKRLPEKLLHALASNIGARNFTGIQASYFRFSADPAEALNAFGRYKLHGTQNAIPDDMMKKIKNMEHAGSKIKGVILATVPEEA